MARRTSAVLAVIALAGCTAPQRPLAPGAAVDRESGFLVLDIADDSFMGAFALVLVDAKGAKVDILLRPETSGTGAQTAVYPVHPGEYRLTGWAVIDFPRRDKAFEADSPLTKPFVVQPGHVVYVGAFLATTSWGPSRYGQTQEWRIEAIPARADMAMTRTRAAHPALSDAPVECLLCSAPPDDATEFARPVLRPAETPAIVPVSLDEASPE